MEIRRIWVFATNSDFLIPKVLQPNYEFCKIKSFKVKYQRLTSSGDTDKGILENMSLWQRLTSFLTTVYLKLNHIQLSIPAQSLFTEKLYRNEFYLYRCYPDKSFFFLVSLMWYIF